MALTGKRCLFESCIRVELLTLDIELRSGRPVGVP